jgi:hypothetical protein
VKYKYIFEGVIHPERTNFHLKGIPEARIIIPIINVEGNLTFEIHDSKFFINLDSDFDVNTHTDPDALLTLKNYMHQHISLWVDAFCYFHSYTYDVEITRIGCEELRINYVPSVQLEPDSNHSKQKDTEFIFDILRLIAQDTHLAFLSLVFADFRRGIKYAYESGGFFYRSVETIRSNYFDDINTSEDKRIKEGWEKMNQELNLKPTDYDFLLKFRVNNMHGVYPLITGAERIRAAKEARKIIDVFINYLKDKYKI